MAKKILAVIFLALVLGNARAQNEGADSLLLQLDSVLADCGKYIEEKENKIARLRVMRQEPTDPEERFWLNNMLFDEYAVYQADSAMVYVNENIGLAQRMGRNDMLQEWRLNKVFLLTAQGLMNEAKDELEEVDTSGLDRQRKFQFYDVKIYLYSHLGQFIGSPQEMTDRYYNMEMLLRWESMKFLTQEDPLYWCNTAFLYEGWPRSEEGEAVKRRLKEIVDSSALTTRLDAINAYALATMYRCENDEGNYMEYLVRSAIADIRNCNRDMASLEELSLIFYDLNDIDRGYACISYCFNAALQYPNRVRMLNISSVLDKIRQAYRDRSLIQEEKLRKSFYTTGILSVVLTVAVVLICVQFRRLSRSRRSLEDSNRLLAAHIRELSDTQRKLKEVNAVLTETNARLNENNSMLFEASYVKEKYIGYVFSICSSYIAKLEDYRKNIRRELVAGRLDSLRKQLSDTSVTQRELKAFFHSFDEVFLQIYPDFVDDFNSLLRPGERISLKKGDLLNTELRIFALVRLGINDSVKIAEFLHCSPQTVYNNRMRTRNKSDISKEEFAERVRTLGKIRR